MKGCGMKFEFVEADNTYVAYCRNGELCPMCEELKKDGFVGANCSDYDALATDSAVGGKN